MIAPAFSHRTVFLVQTEALCPARPLRGILPAPPTVRRVTTRRSFSVLLALAVTCLFAIGMPRAKAWADGPVTAGVDTPAMTIPDAMPVQNLGVDAATSLTDGFNIAASGFSLDQIDLSTGQVMGNDVTSALSGDASATMALAEGDGMAFNVSALAAAAASQAASQQAALAANLAGCPSSTPAGTLRGGAVDLAKICADSVAQARSPQAATAIKNALNNLGAPYSQPNRNTPGQFDCSSFVTRMYQAAGVNIAPSGQNAPTTETIATAPWAIHEDISQARPGDLVEPFSGHVVMLLAGGFIAETSSPGDVSHVTSAYWTTPYLAVWIDPSKA